MFGKVTLVIATTGLAVTGSLGGKDRPAVLIFGIAGFIILHAAVNFVGEDSIVHRLGQNYDQVQRRAVQVISDLGQLAADQFGIWMVDLYLPEHTWSFTSRRPFIERRQVLSRQLSVSLVDARPQPTSIEPSYVPHGKCFSETQPLLWFDQAVHGPRENNTWETIDIEAGDELEKKYGVLAVSPLVDHLGKDCRGVLAIHAGPERSDAFKALGALNSQQGRLRVSNACVDLHGLLGK
ncbi:MAG: hypothetical protein OXH61_12065 [Acidimicrobiaceae bacterium]|nr:hypothetical protein [Acidimicrobiaceae bacterium]